MTDSLDLEAIKWVSNITFFINTQNEWLYKLHLFQKYSKYLKLYDSDRAGGGTVNKEAAPNRVSSITELFKDKSIRYSDLFKIHALVVDQSYLHNAELVSVLEGHCQNNGYRTCLLIRKSDALGVFDPSGESHKQGKVGGIAGQMGMTNPRIHPQDPANPVHPGQHMAPLIEASDSRTGDLNSLADAEKKKTIDFSIFDHVILLNDDDTAFNEAYVRSQHQHSTDSGANSQRSKPKRVPSFSHLLSSSQTIKFQIYQFLQNCQREALARYALSLSNDYFLRLKANDLTLLDTNTTQFAGLLGEKIQLQPEVLRQLESQVACTKNDSQSTLEQGIKATVTLNNEIFTCRIWMADEGIDNDYIVRIQHTTTQAVATSRRSSVDSLLHGQSVKRGEKSPSSHDLNNNKGHSVKQANTDDTCSPLESDQFYHASRRSSARRRSSLAHLRTKMSQKSPVNDILKRIDEARDRVRAQQGGSDEGMGEMMELFDTMSTFLNKVEPELAAKINPTALSEPQNQDLAEAMLNKSSSKTSELPVHSGNKSPKGSDTSIIRRSSTIKQLTNRSIIKNPRSTQPKHSLTEMQNRYQERHTIPEPGATLSTIATTCNSQSDLRQAFQNGRAIPIQDANYPMLSPDLEVTYPVVPDIRKNDMATIKSELERNATNWEFDCFKIEQLSSNTTLEILGMELFKKFNVFEVLKIDEKTSINWLKLIQANYRQANSYHNSTHAADVMQATATFLMSQRCSQLMSPLDKVACLLSAAVHDVDHRGKTNQYLTNSLDPLAVLYNDKAVLENHHAATAFRLTLEVDESFNIFKNMDEAEFKSFRAIVIEMVLATEMSQHFGIVNKFISLASQDQTWKAADSAHLAAIKSGHGASSVIAIRRPSDFMDHGKDDENHKLLISLARQMIIKVSDISNPVRPIERCVVWTKRICEEYFEQTDDEQRKGLPVVMPTFDRTTCSVPKSQIFFIDYFVRDMVDAWSDFINDDKLMKYLDDNQAFWRRLEARGSKTIQDLQDHKQEEMARCRYLKDIPDSSSTDVSVNN